LELLSIFTAALFVAFSGAIMPGPLLTVAIEESTLNGWKAALLLIVGHSLLELVLVAGLCLGLASFLHNQIIIRAIGICGGLFLLWMGYSMIIDVYRGRIPLDFDTERKAIGFKPIVQGITTSASNPYWTLWWVTIGAGFVASALKSGTPAITSFYFGHISGDFIWYGFVGFLVATGKRFINARVYKAILLICGLFLVLLAISFIFDLPLF
jgi:threonine/homoserine/homoserine lactone efflux protein